MIDIKSHHRPGWIIPAEKWVFYQEWNKAIFLHWRVDAELLRPFVPSGITLDTFEGSAWVSLVGFSMEQVRPRQLPAVSFLSNFHELNVRTYVTDGRDAGAYFLSIEAQKFLSAYVSRSLSGMPYEKADMHRTIGDWNTYRSYNRRTKNLLDVEYSAGEPIEKTPLDVWLTERYYAYVHHRKTIYKFNIHHEEWPITRPEIRRLEVYYRFGEMLLKPETMELAHYSPGVQVIAWGRKAL